jgi:hypothetical protein
VILDNLSAHKGANARHRDVSVAERRESTRIRSAKGIR